VTFRSMRATRHQVALTLHALWQAPSLLPYRLALVPKCHRRCRSTATLDELRHFWSPSGALGLRARRVHGEPDHVRPGCTRCEAFGLAPRRVRGEDTWGGEQPQDRLFPPAPTATIARRSGAGPAAGSPAAARPWRCSSAPTSKTKPERTRVRSPRFTALQAHALTGRTVRQSG